MRYVTTAQDLGERKVPGASHRAHEFGLSPGRAWKIDDEKKDHVVVEVGKSVADAAEYLWELRWIDGRTVAVFQVDGVQFAQPTRDDPRARDRNLGSTRKRGLRSPRRDAPGVAPEVSGQDERSARDEASEAPRTPGMRRPKRPLTIEL